jgi:hypothetical protein
VAVAAGAPILHGDQARFGNDSSLELTVDARSDPSILLRRPGNVGSEPGAELGMDHCLDIAQPAAST